MKHLINYSDSRARGQCLYCGGPPETKEHVPSRVLLDRPLPDNLPIVEACKSCNNGFSLDEEYLACLLDCILSGSVNPEDLQRENIKRTMKKRPSIAKKMKNALKEVNGKRYFKIEYDRVERVVLKIAQGHILYEINELYRDSATVQIAPFSCMEEGDIQAFENLPQQNVCPEVGSRGMQRLMTRQDLQPSGWIIVQPNRYRFTVLHSERTEVRMVLSEYLACRVFWE